LQPLGPPAGLQHVAKRVPLEGITMLEVLVEHGIAVVPAEALEVGGMDAALPADDPVCDTASMSASMGQDTRHATHGHTRDLGSNAAHKAPSCVYRSPAAPATASARFRSVERCQQARRVLPFAG